MNKFQTLSKEEMLDTIKVRAGEICRDALSRPVHLSLEEELDKLAKKAAELTIKEWNDNLIWSVSFTATPPKPEHMPALA